MTSWPASKARRVIAAWYRIGWTLKRQSGSHKTLNVRSLHRDTAQERPGPWKESRVALCHRKSFDALCPAQPAWLPKTNFFMLMRDETLAQLRTRFDEQNGFFAIECDGETLLRTRITNGLRYGCEVRSTINGNALRRTS